MEEKRFLDVNGLTNYVHVSKSLIYKLVSTDRIPHIKIGTRTLFDKVQIDQWVINGGKKVEELPKLIKLSK